MSKRAIAIIIIACMLGAGQFPVAHAASHGKGQSASQEVERAKKKDKPQKSSPQQHSQPAPRPPQHHQQGGQPDLRHRPNNQHGQPAHMPPQRHQQGGQPDLRHRPNNQHGQSAHIPPQHHQAHKPPSDRYNHSKYKDSHSWNSHHGHFRPGHAMPSHYRHDHNRYIVHSWHSYGLYAPPPGHHWLQIDGTFVLVAAATGIVAHILMGH